MKWAFWGAEGDGNGQRFLRDLPCDFWVRRLVGENGRLGWRCGDVGTG
ncbi:MAG: hypothetical protein M5U34_42290 [Chloroflexi bacterium]|nr:hypothetical protein [Chloroflexota bacterium]